MINKYTALKGMSKSPEVYVEMYSIEELKELINMAYRANKLHHRFALIRAMALKEIRK